MTRIEPGVVSAPAPDTPRTERPPCHRFARLALGDTACAWCATRLPRDLACSGMTTTVDLLNYFRTHLADFELPTLWSPTVTASSTGPNVSVHLACHGPAEIASGLLAWADTLSEVTTETWRVPDGYSCTWPR